MQFVLSQQHIFRKTLIALCVGLLFVALPLSAAAQFNPEINYQGKLTNASGVAVPDGLYNMNFWLVPTQGGATSTAVWSEARTSGNRVQVTNGLFSVMLGEVATLDSVDFNQTLYLGVEIGGISTTTPTWDGEMSPRKILGAVPAAFVAETASSADALSGIASSSFLRSDEADTMQATSSSPILTLIQNGAGAVARFFSGVTEVFTILGNGNIGVGTSTPSARFTVAGDARITGTSTLATTTISSLSLGTALTAVNGGTGLNTVTQNQLLIGGAGNTWTQVATSSLGLGNGTFLGLTDTPSSYTANRIMFTNSGATALTDSANFTFDGTNLGLGAQSRIAFGGTNYLYASSTNDSIVFGENAGATFTNNTTFNVAIGYEAGRYASTSFSGTNNFIGARAGIHNRGSLNNLFGYFTGANNSGNQNNIIGDTAGSNNTGSYNNIFGYVAGNNNTGNENNLTGQNAGANNTGDYNNIFGAATGFQNTGSYNNFFGSNAGQYNTGNFNEMIGYEAGRNLRATSSIIIGAQAFRGGAGFDAFSATNNVALGYRAGYNATTSADNNILIGYRAADNLTTGNNNIIIGYDIDNISATTDNALNIGNLIFGTGLDGTGTTLASGNVGIGTSTPGSKLTVAGDLQLTGVFRDGSNASGTLGMVLQTTGTSTRWVATSTLGLSAAFSNSAQLAALLSDETGTGLAVFNTSPVFNTQISTPVLTSTTTLSIDSSSTNALNIGTGANAKTITIGNGTGATSLVLNAGTGALNIGTNAVARTTTIGNTTGASSLVLNSGTGAISIGTSIAKTITIGNNTGATGLVFTSGTGGTAITGGNVAVGTTTASARLSIQGGFGSTTALFDVATTTSAGFATSSLFRVNANGNVGIGTSSPTTKLDVYGNLVVGTSSSPLLYANTAARQLTLGTSTVLTDYNAVTPLLALSGSASGRQAKLLLNEESADQFASGVIQFARTNNAANRAVGSIQFLNAASIESYTDTADAEAGSLIFNTDAPGAGPSLTERMRITSAGNVGIGSTTPSSLLTVAGNTYIGGELRLVGGLRDGANATGTLGMVLQTTGTSTRWVATSTLGLGGATTFLALTDTPSSYTANRIIFTNSGATALTDSANFTFDGTNLGLGAQSRIAFGGTNYLYASSTNDSVVFGENAGATFTNLTTNNVAIGFEAGRYASTSASDLNVFIGDQAGLSNTGFNNNLFGDRAGLSNTGSYNNVFGTVAGLANTGSNVNLLGTYAGQNNTGDYNNIFAYDAGYSNTGSYANLFGYAAGFSNTGNYVNFFGESAGRSNRADEVNAFGTSAGRNNTGTSSNILGYSAGYNNTGSSTNLLGYYAGYANTGDYVNALGQFAGRNNSGDYNNYIGYQAGATSTGSFNNAIGYQAGASSTGQYNNLIGYQSGLINRGDNNFISGVGAGYSNTGSENFIFGYYTATNNTGSYNNILGGSAANNNTGSYNNILGYSAATKNTGNFNEIFGYETGYNIRATSSVLIGTQAFRGADFTAFSAVNNVALGYQAGYNATNNADNNILIGYRAADNITTGNNNIIIGYDIDNVTATADNRLNIGNLIFGTGLDGTGTTLASGNVGIGSTTPSARLTVQGASGSTAPTFSVASSTGSTTFTVLANGNVGIGTSTPSNKLDILGGGINIVENTAPQIPTIRMDLSSAVDEKPFIYATANRALNYGIALENTNSGGSVYNSMRVGSADIDFSLVQGGGDGLAVFASPDGGGNILSMLTDNGNVGIGTTTQASKLTVVGDMRLTGAFRDGSNASGTLGMVLQSTGTTTRWVATSSLGISGGASTFLALTDTPSSYTANRIIFTNSGATALTDSANFTFDGTNLGLGAQSRIAFGGTNYLYASSTNDSIVFGENAGATFTNLTTNNVAIGFEAGRYASTSAADINNYVGFWAGQNNTGSNNNLFGPYAGRNNTGSRNNLLGSFTGSNNTGSDNNFFGEYAGINNTGSRNNILGLSAGQGNTGTDTNIFGYFAGNDNTGSSSNLFGRDAGRSNDGDYVNLLGQNAGRDNQGDYANFFGFEAGATSTGAYNNFLGYRSGADNTGSDNNIFGRDAGRFNSGTDNNIFGWVAGYNNTGTYNNLFGVAAGEDNSGSAINALGYRAGQFNSGDDLNTFGYESGRFNQGAYNNFMGAFAGSQNDASFVNAFGLNAGSLNTGSSTNLFGPFAGYENTGDYVDAIGALAGYNNIGDYNSFMGYSAGATSTGSYNAAIGYLAGASTTGSYNNSIGWSAGAYSIGDNNNFFGRGAGSVNSGESNNFIGNDTGNENSGDYNSMLGTMAGYYNTGSFNNLLGYQAGFQNTGSYNEMIGYEAGKNLQATSSIIIGSGAFRGGSCCTPFSAVNNVALGYQAGYNATTSADNNILIGYRAADNITTGNNNIIIGYDIDNVTATADNRLNIGNLIFGTGLDGTGTTLASGNVGIGTSTPGSKLTVAGDLQLTGAFRDGSNASGTLGMVLQSTGTSTRWVATSTLGISGGSSLFTDGGATTYLTATGDNLAIGTTTATSKLTIEGDIAISTNVNLGQTSIITVAGERYIHGYTLNNTFGVNQFIGFQAGNFTSGSSTNAFLGIDNLGVGRLALSSITEASNSTAVGTLSLSSLTTGYANTAVGARSLAFTTTGSDNNAFGNEAMYSNTTGYRNVAVGTSALYANQTGDSNVAIGYRSLISNITGSTNVGVGNETLYAATTTGSNTAIGHFALRLVTADSNTAVGAYAGSDLTLGTNNTILGNYTGLGITTGSYNTIIGSNVTGLSSSLSNNIIIADGQGNRRINVDSSGNVGIGTTTPSARLTIQGASGATADTFRVASSSGALALSVLANRDVEVPGQIISAGVEWTARSAAGNNDVWSSVTYGNGLFVAVGQSGDRVMTSPDGINWATTTAAGDNDIWNDVTYGNGLFVAVGRSGDRVMTSPDGINWTARSAAGNDDIWYGITYGNGLFVAVGSSSDPVMTSPDGITWTVRSAAGNDDPWRAVTYGNGLFVAVSDLNDRVMTSPDGINWTARSAAGNNDEWYGITYGNGLFVAVGAYAGDRVMTSPDGINWTARSAAGNNDDLQDITYGNGLFVAVSESGDRVMTSPDGINWTARSAAGNDDFWYGITYGNGLFVAVGASDDLVMISGKTFTNLLGTNNIFQGGIRLSTTTTSARLGMEYLNFAATNTAAGIDQYFSFSNSSNGATLSGNRTFLYATNTATTTIIGSITRVADSTTFGNTVRGLEVQADNGNNTQGENTGIAAFGRTFGVRGTTVGDAGGTFEPAGIYGETEGTTQGNAIRGYSSSITTAALLKLFQDTSTFTGTGLLMNFGNAGGSFSSTTASRFIDLQNAGTSRFTVGAYGMVTIGDGTMTNNAGIQIGYGGLCVDNDGSCNASTTGRVSAVSYYTANSDLAETYFSSEDLQSGEVVYLKGELSVGRASEDTEEKIIGVVTTKPGLLLGSDDSSLRAGEDAFGIALAGRVPVRLSNENGPIKAGDELMLSSIPGVAMKASSTGVVVGIALEDFEETRAYSDTYINQFGDDIATPVFTPINPNNDPRINDGCYYGAGSASGDAPCVPLQATTTDAQAAEAEALALAEAQAEALEALKDVPSDVVTLDNGETVRVGQVVMFVALDKRYLDEDGIAMVAALLASGEGADEDATTDTIWNRLVTLANNFIDGVLSVLTLKADRVEVQNEICVDGVCLNAEDIRQLLDGNTTPPAPEGTPEPEPVVEEEESEEGNGGGELPPVVEEEVPNETGTSTEEVGETETETESTEPEMEETPEPTVTEESEEVVEESSEEETEIVEEVEEENEPAAEEPEASTPEEESIEEPSA